MLNAIFLRRKAKVMVANGGSSLPDVYLATALKNLESFGYTFSPALIQTLRTLFIEDFVSFYEKVLSDTKKIVGAHVPHQPLYPNFPEQVMNASDAELYVNNIIHYFDLMTYELSNHEITQNHVQYEKKERFPLMERFDLKTIDLGTFEEFEEMIRHLIGANTSISASDKEDICTVLSTSEDASLFLPSKIPSKENLAFVIGTLFRLKKCSVKQLSGYFTTATDVLRLATAFSDGDVSLSSDSHFRKFKRSERRLLLELMENISNPTEDMLRHRMKWIRLGEILHPKEYQKRYPKTGRAFDILRNKVPFETFNQQVEVALASSNVDGAVRLLMKRPGEFARRLDHLLRMGHNHSFVLAAFEEVSPTTSTPVLLQVMAHFKHRNKPKDSRVFFPKGNVAKLFATENNLPSIAEETCLQVVGLVEKTLVKRFSALPPLGKVVLHPDLKNHVVPFSQRSASKTLRSLTRGSQIYLPEGNIIRFFLWWKEEVVNGESTGSVDIDLSAATFDASWNDTGHISFSELRNSFATHSGDIRFAPKGASEFIDIDIPKFLEAGGRYVVMNLYSYSEQPYCDLPECFAGWMIREEAQIGEIYEPSTVQNKFDITSDTTIVIPVVLDLLERKVIWTDLALTKSIDFGYANTVENAKSSIALLSQSMLSLAKPSLYDLFLLHVKARGELVDSTEEVDTVFSMDEGITPFDVEKIMAEFLA